MLLHEMTHVQNGEYMDDVGDEARPSWLVFTDSFFRLTSAAASLGIGHSRRNPLMDGNYARNLPKTVVSLTDPPPRMRLSLTPIVRIETLIVLHFLETVSTSNDASRKRKEVSVE